MRTRALLVVILLIGCIFFLASDFWYPESPWVLAAGIAAITFGILAYISQNLLTRAFWVNLPVIVSTVGAFEFYLLSNDGDRLKESFRGTYTTDNYVEHGSHSLSEWAKAWRNCALRSSSVRRHSPIHL